jgi:hypothetical protein
VQQQQLFFWSDDLSFKSACSGDHVNLAGYLRTASLVWIILES